MHYSKREVHILCKQNLANFGQVSMAPPPCVSKSKHWFKPPPPFAYTSLKLPPSPSQKEVKIGISHSKLLTSAKKSLLQTNSVTTH